MSRLLSRASPLISAVHGAPSRASYDAIGELHKLLLENPQDWDFEYTALIAIIAPFRHTPPRGPRAAGDWVWSERLACGSLQCLASVMDIDGGKRDDPNGELRMQIIATSRDAMSLWISHLLSRCLDNPQGATEQEAWRAFASGVTLWTNTSLLVPRAVDLVLPLWLAMTRDTSMAIAIKHACGDISEEVHSVVYSLFMASCLDTSVASLAGVLHRDKVSGSNQLPDLPQVRARLLLVQDEVVQTALCHIEDKLAGKPITWSLMRRPIQLLCVLLSSRGFSSHPELVSRRAIECVVRIYNRLLREGPSRKHPDRTALLFSVHHCTWFLEFVFLRPDRVRWISVAIKAGLLKAIAKSSPWMREQGISFQALASCVGPVENRLQFFNDVILAHLAIYPVFKSVHDVVSEMPSPEVEKQQLDGKISGTLRRWRDADSKIFKVEMDSLLDDKHFCQNLECSRPQGTRMLRCQGCGERYQCSRQCQAQGWSQVGGNHRAVCKPRMSRIKNDDLLCSRAEITFAAAVAELELGTVSEMLKREIPAGLRDTSEGEQFLSLHVQGIEPNLMFMVGPPPHEADPKAWKLAWADVLAHENDQTLTMAIVPGCRGPSTAAYCVIPRPVWLDAQN